MNVEHDGNLIIFILFYCSLWIDNLKLYNFDNGIKAVLLSLSLSSSVCVFYIKHSFNFDFQTTKNR